MKRNTTPVVDAITEMSHAGNVVNPLWIHWIKEKEPKACAMASTAVLVLSDIIYWYRASVVRDEVTGRILEVKKRFKENKLQRSYDAIAEQWNITKRQAQRAVYLLRDAGLITVETRTILSQGVKIPNVVFLEPIPENIAKAGEMTIKPKTVVSPELEGGHTKKGDTSSQNRQDKYIDYTETIAETTPPVVPQGGPPAECSRSLGVISTRMEVTEPIQTLPLFQEIKEPGGAASLAVSPGSSISEPAIETTQSGKKAKLTAVELEPFRVEFNDKKPAAWAECLKLDESRVRKIAGIVKEHGEGSLDLWRDALSYARSDNWCLGKKLTIDNFMTNNKVVIYAEKWRSKGGGATQYEAHRQKSIDALTNLFQKGLQNND